jgi:hypothetical protein
LSRVGSIAFVALLASAATAGEATHVHAVVAPAISIAQCLNTIANGAARDEVQCPAFLIDSLKQARQTCADAGGKLEATAAPDVWSIDVNADGVPEYVFEYDANVSCEGAWSVFDCGSLGCAKGLYQKHDGAWQAIAEIWADAPESIEVLDTPAGPDNHDLRVGCSGADPCNEYWHYLWSGRQYERTYLEARGHRVDFASSIHGLYGLVGETDVLTAPSADSAAIGHYGSNTEVEIVGTAAGADYYYVSPCNACDSGFVPKAAVRPLQQ